MEFLLAAALRLEHPEPSRLLHRSHPLFRWAGVPDIPTWWWANTNERDKRIYTLLRRA